MDITIEVDVAPSNLEASIEIESPIISIVDILPTGPRGLKGDTGEQGEQGIQGIQGEPGESPDLTELEEDVAGLHDDVTQEISDRIGADNALDTRLDTAEGDIDTVQTGLAQEVTNRGNADNALDARLDAIEGLGSLATDAELASESAARSAADDDLQDAIDTEISDRAGADVTLQDNIDTEAQAREDADDALTGAISTEASTRATQDALLIPLTQKGATNGVATLDSNALIPTNQLPGVAITSTFVVNSQASMLALIADEGDVAIRTDLNKTFILQTSPATVLANWKELLTPTDLVASVDGRTGVVTLTDLYDASGTAASAVSAHAGNTNNPHSVTKSQVGLGNADNTSDVNKPVSTAQQTALDAKVLDGAWPTGWDSDTTHAASRNAIYDAIQTLIPTLPGAVLGHADTTAQVGINNVVSDILTITFDVPATRAVEVTAFLANLGGGTLNATVTGTITDSGNVLKATQTMRIPATGTSGSTVSASSTFLLGVPLLEVIPAGSGTVTRKLRAVTSTGTGNVSTANSGLTYITAKVR